MLVYLFFAFFHAFLIIFHFVSTFFFFNDAPTTEIYTLSLHDALPISDAAISLVRPAAKPPRAREVTVVRGRDRKSTRLNSSHANISYAVFCLKKKKKKTQKIN